jgi:hypothetical protein
MKLKISLTHFMHSLHPHMKLINNGEVIFVCLSIYIFHLHSYFIDIYEIWKSTFDVAEKCYFVLVILIDS